MGLPYGNAYTGFFTFSQAFDAGKLGVDRIGAYAMVGEAPTYYLTHGGTPLAGSGIGNKGFNREGFVGQFYFGQHFDLQVVTQHGSDNAWFGQGYGDLIGGTGARATTCRGRPFRWARRHRPGTAFCSNLTTCTARS